MQSVTELICFFYYSHPHYLKKGQAGRHLGILEWKNNAIKGFKLFVFCDRNKPFSWDYNGHKISLLFEIWQQLSLFCSNYLCLSLWWDPTGPLLAAVVHLGWSGRDLIQIIVAIPGRPCRAPGPQLLSQPHSHSVECEYSLPGHIIIGSVVFVLLPEGFIAGLRGPF